MKDKPNLTTLIGLFIICIVQWSVIYNQSQRIKILYEIQREMVEIDQIMLTNMEKLIQNQIDSLQ